MSQQEITRVVCRKIRESIENRTVDVSVVFDVAIMAMRIVERTQGLEGGDKKAIVCEVVKTIIGELDIPDDKRDAINTMVTVIVPVAIDVIIASENGALKIVKRGCARCV